MSARSGPEPVSALPPVVGLDLDPDEAARKKEQRRTHLNVVQIPVLRGFGLLMIAAFVHLNNAYLLSPGTPANALAFTLAVSVYAAASWAILALFFRRCPVDLGLVFLAGDIGLMTYGTYCSGGERSWLFFLPLARIADQTSTTFRRVVVFVHLGVFAFITMAAYLAFVEGRPLDWRPEGAKALVLYGIGLYMSLTARTSEQLRARTTQAIHVARDLIGRLRETSRDLQDSMLRAEAASRTKSEFLATVSHEIRTPMNAVIGMTELLLDTPLSTEQREYAETVRRSGEGLLSIIDGVLDFSRLEAGKLSLDEADVDVHAVVEEAVGLLAERAGDKGLGLSHLVAPDVSRRLRGDPGRLRQILLNLVGNAVKFTERGEVLVRVGLAEAIDRSVTLRFEVRDTGIGIPEEARRRLFHAFSQVDGSTTRRFGGTGLGLAISRRLVELMGGAIDFESVPGRGSTFWFTACFTRAEGEPDHARPWLRAGGRAGAPA